MQRTLTVFTQLDPRSVARVEITIVEDGIGPMDHSTERQPTVPEFDHVTQELHARRWDLRNPL